MTASSSWVGSSINAEELHPHLEIHQVRELMGSVSNVVYEQILEAVHANNSADVLSIVGRLLDAGNGAPQLARQFVRYLRNTIVAKVTNLTPGTDATGIAADLLQISPEERNRAARSAALFTEEELSRFLSIVLRTFDELGYRQEQRFHLELGLLKLVHVQRLVPIEELLSQLGAKPSTTPNTTPTTTSGAPSSATASSSPKVGGTTSVPTTPRGTTTTSGAPHLASEMWERTTPTPGGTTTTPSPSSPPKTPPSRPESSASTPQTLSSRPESASSSTPQTLSSRPESASSSAPQTLSSRPESASSSAPQTLSSRPESAPTGVPIGRSLPEWGGVADAAERPAVPQPASIGNIQVPQGFSLGSHTPIENGALAPALLTAGSLALAPEASPIQAPIPSEIHLVDLSPESDTSPTHDLTALHTVLIAALASVKGQQSASEQLEESTLALKGTTLEIQTTLSKTMLPVVLNTDAERILKTALRNANAGSLTLKLLPGVPAASGVPKKPRKATSGSAAELAEKHPMVQEARRLFSADISNVIDLRDKD